jgi:transcriptional regulator with XRE-family HTH domain
MPQRELPGRRALRARRRQVRQARRDAHPQPPRPAITPLPVSYRVHMRNTSQQKRGTWATYAQAARERAGLNKAEAARRIGVDRGTVHRWEIGQNRPEDPDVVSTVAKVYGVDIDEALAAAGMKPGQPAPSEPTVERDPEIEAILAAPVSPIQQKRMLELLFQMRERDRQRRMEDIAFLLERETGR